jgi:micrococcal nuclease
MITAFDNKHFIKPLLTLIWFFCTSVSADVYQWEDKNGRKHFTDKAQENSTKLKISTSYSYQKVTRVFDGDTVMLEDGRKIRLLGINTPEVKHKNQDTEAGGESAKRWLSNKLINQKVRLVTDTEQTDKYKRTLAHLFTDKKEHINLQLVALGLATVNIYPPNLLYSEELTTAGNQAEKNKSGIWLLENYARIPLENLNSDGHSGWTRLTGRVSVIRSSRKFVYMEFSDFFQARIEKRWLSLFPDINSYQGKTLEIRGWLNKNHGGWSMLIRHPSAIKILE